MQQFNGDHEIAPLYVWRLRLLALVICAIRLLSKHNLRATLFAVEIRC